LQKPKNLIKEAKRHEKVEKQQIQKSGSVPSKTSIFEYIKSFILMDFLPFSFPVCHCFQPAVLYAVITMFKNQSKRCLHFIFSL